MRGLLRLYAINPIVKDYIRNSIALGNNAVRSATLDISNSILNIDFYIERYNNIID